MGLIERIEKPGQKKLLAIDGGGIRGVLSLGILQRVEDLLKAESKNPSFVLADYFDYISGTSTGGIIAAGLSKGMSVAAILKFYRDAGPEMFQKTSLRNRLRYKFESEPLALKLKDVFGENTTFGSDELKTLLLLVMRNATTDSPWPLANNPYAKYNKARSDCNLNFPLWQLVRASTAAPTYFPPEVIVLEGDPAKNQKDKEFVFVDGGVTMYNNPAFQMFLMATLDRYWPQRPAMRWKTGTDKMLIVSVGTGTAPDARMSLEPDDMNLLFNASAIPSALMYAALNEQDQLCRIFGNCLAGEPIDREIDTLIGCDGPLGADQKMFTYVRYNAELTRSGLDALGCNDILPEKVQKLDSVEGIDDLLKVGKAVADRKVEASHFKAFPV